MDYISEQYLEEISNTLYRIANTLEELLETTKPKQPEKEPTTESIQTSKIGFLDPTIPF